MTLKHVSTHAGQALGLHQSHVALVNSKLPRMLRAFKLTGATVTVQPAHPHPVTRYDWPDQSNHALLCGCVQS